MKHKIQFITDAAKLNGEVAWFKVYNGEMFVAFVPWVIYNPDVKPHDAEFNLTLDEAYDSLLIGC